MKKIISICAVTAGIILIFSFVIISCAKDNTNEIKSASNCQSVSNCDCSIKTKSECTADPDCCKWVNSACECR